MLEALGRLWVLGVDVDWQGFNLRRRRTRVPLPTYPFERRRYWIDAHPVDKQAQPASEAEQAQPSPGKLYPRPELRKPYAAPATKDQEKLAGIWQQVLAIDKIGINDDFFELGGNSLLATQLVMETREAFKTSVPLREFFETPTIAELSALLQSVEATAELPPIKPIPRRSLTVDRNTLAVVK